MFRSPHLLAGEPSTPRPLALERRLPTRGPVWIFC
jgi:hypothetical protein